TWEPGAGIPCLRCCARLSKPADASCRMNSCRAGPVTWRHAGRRRARPRSLWDGVRPVALRKCAVMPGAGPSASIRSRMKGLKQLPWIHDRVRIEDLLDLHHQPHMHRVLMMVEGMAFELPDAMLGADASTVFGDLAEYGIGDPPLPILRPGEVGPVGTRDVVMQIAVAKEAEHKQTAVRRSGTQAPFGRREEGRNLLNRQGDVVLQMRAIGTLRFGNL